MSDPTNPRQICFWKTAGTGVHRFDFDGRHAYITPEVEGYHLNIAMILDLENPAKPREVGRWWMPGQWVAGGETPDEGYRMTWCHQVLRRGNRLYVAYWHGGMVILDIEDEQAQAGVEVRVQPGLRAPTHTVLPLPFELAGRKIAIVADEDVRKVRPSPPPFMWLFDITDETQPVPISTYQIEELMDKNMPGVHGLPPTGRAGVRHRDPGGVVRQGPARGRREEPARAARGGALRAGHPGLRPGADQRRLPDQGRG